MQKWQNCIDIKKNPHKFFNIDKKKIKKEKIKNFR